MNEEDKADNNAPSQSQTVGLPIADANDCKKSMVATTKRKAPKTAFKKGQSGNPGGMPKDVPSIKRAMKAVITRKDCEDIAKALLKLCLAGDTNAIKLMAGFFGDLDPQSPLQINNNFSIGQEIVDRAKEYYAATVVDVTPVTAVIEDKKPVDAISTVSINDLKSSEPVTAPLNSVEDAIKEANRLFGEPAVSAPKPIEAVKPEDRKVGRITIIGNNNPQ